MDNQKPNDTSEKTTQKKCVCSSLQGLFIPNRQLSVAVSGCIAMLFFSFMTGYFFGGQHAAQDFMHHVDHVSFNDQMSASLCALAKECTTVSTNDNEEDLSTAPILANITEDNSFQECVTNEVIPEPVLETNTSKKKYYAQLIGFGTQQAAQRFAKKLAKKQIPVEINKHCSRTAHGKTINWYQVVTKPYEDKKQLLDLVTMVQKAENIQDVRIVTC